jgi:hypothetical protein
MNGGGGGAQYSPSSLFPPPHHSLLPPSTGRLELHHTGRYDQSGRYDQQQAGQYEHHQQQGRYDHQQLAGRYDHQGRDMQQQQGAGRYNQQKEVAGRYDQQDGTQDRSAGGPAGQRTAPPGRPSWRKGEQCLAKYWEVRDIYLLDA